MIIEIAGSLAVPVVGWLVNKQLESNRMVREHAEDIKALKDNTAHTRTRVDDIYNHLIQQAERN